MKTGRVPPRSMSRYDATADPSAARWRLPGPGMRQGAARRAPVAMGRRSLRGLRGLCRRGRRVQRESAPAAVGDTRRRRLQRGGRCGSRVAAARDGARRRDRRRRRAHRATGLDGHDRRRAAGDRRDHPFRGAVASSRHAVPGSGWALRRPGADFPHALFGGGLLTDPRLWFGAVFVITFGGALSVMSVPYAWRWTALITASPLIAFPLSTGGDDLPVLALMCLGLALLGTGPNRSRPVAAGLVLGLAAAMKATAWPALAVALALAAARDGRRGVAWLAASALGVAAVADGPVLATHPGDMVVNTILFPLGLTKIKSPAASWLPRHLIAQAWGGGHWVSIALVVISGLAVAGSLIVRPPRDARAAGWRLVAGLTLMFAFAPASRVGYFVYPLGLAAWLLAARASRPPAATPGLSVRIPPVWADRQS